MPTETQQHLNAIMESLDQHFNPEIATGSAPKVGIVLLTFPYGEYGRVNYISNGARRADMMALFQSLLDRWHGKPIQHGQA